MRFPKFPLLFATLTVAFVALAAQGKLTPEQVAQLPKPASAKINFAADVKPIFDAACVKCHGKGKDKGGFSLETLDGFLKGGDTGSPIVPGRSAESLVIEMVSGLNPDNVMPQKGSKLKPEQVALLRAWIDQGAAWPEDITFRKIPVNNLHPRRPELPVVPGMPNPVDRLLAPYFAAHKIKPAPLIDDRVFARRVYLDVIGMLPPPQELNQFLSDTRPNKRDLLVNKLLSDRRGYAEHWLTFWNDHLRNDYKGTGYIDGGRKQISTWLYDALYQNIPYDRFVSELVNPSKESQGFVDGFVWRGAVNASQQPPVQAAQHIGQVFLGVNLKCASCHDSFINDYTLADAYGLAAIYAKEPLEIAECDKPTGKFAKTKFLYSELGSIDGNLPKEERTKQLAALLTARTNGRLTRTVVNRVWARFMGRGLVEPVDEMDTPAWNPDVLDWLSEEMAETSYDLKRMMRWILTSRAYQMPSVDLGEQLGKDFVFAGPAVRRMNAEQFRDAMGRLTGVLYTLPADGLRLPKQSLATTNSLVPPRARWISAESAAEKGASNQTIYIRKTFRLPTVPAKAFGAVACDNNFTLFVNGTQVAQGKDFQKATFVHLTPHLRPGANVIAVSVLNSAVSTPDLPNTKGKEYKNDSRPPGFFFSALFPGESLELFTDRTWIWSSAKTNGWQKIDFDSSHWAFATEFGAMEMTLHSMSDKVEEALAMSNIHGATRASLVPADALMIALGRPNREQVITSRQSAATTLQALELTNGETFDKLLKRGAEKVLAAPRGTPYELIAEIFIKSLGRPPTEKESQIAVELVGSPAKQEGLEDFLWSVAMLPEFQLIY